MMLSTPVMSVHLHPVDWIIPIVLGLIVALGCSWLWKVLIQTAWAFGFDSRHRLAYTIPPVRFILFLGVWTTIALPAWEDDPADRLLIGGFLTLILTIWAFKHFRDIAAGLTISIVRPFALGDQVGTPQASGRLVSLGLTRSKLRTPAGTWVDVANSELLANTVRVSSKYRGALPIEVLVSILVDCESDLYLAALRDETLLSPYTDAGSPVVLELLDDRHVKITATPVHPDDTDELRSDLMGRAVAMKQTWTRRTQEREN
jgi:small-conductance mechanosensitive channel